MPRALLMQSHRDRDAVLGGTERLRRLGPPDRGRRLVGVPTKNGSASPAGFQAQNPARIGARSMHGRMVGWCKPFNRSAIGQPIFARCDPIGRYGEVDPVACRFNVNAWQSDKIVVHPTTFKKCDADKIAKKDHVAVYCLTLLCRRGAAVPFRTSRPPRTAAATRTTEPFRALAGATTFDANSHLGDGAGAVDVSLSGLA
jgi:hypothetical protein